MIEIFKDIQGYEGYQISNLGNVKELCNGKILSRFKNSGGYLMVRLVKDNKGKHLLVHRLVAEAFIPNPNNYPMVNHRDEDKTNPTLSNLEWCDAKYNNSYGLRLHKEKQIYCIEEDMIYLNAKEAAYSTGCNQDDILRCCNGKLKTCGNLHWRFIKM